MKSAKIIFEFMKKIGFLGSLTPILLIFWFSIKTDSPLPPIDTSFASFYFMFFVLFSSIVSILSIFIIFPFFIQNFICDEYGYFYCSSKNILPKSSNIVYDYFSFNLPFLTFLSVYAVMTILREINAIDEILPFLIMAVCAFIFSLIVSSIDFFSRLTEKKFVSIEIFRPFNILKMIEQSNVKKNFGVLKIMPKFIIHNLIVNISYVIWALIFSIPLQIEAYSHEYNRDIYIFFMFFIIIFLHFFHLMPNFDFMQKNKDTTGLHLLVFLALPIYILLSIAPGLTVLTKKSLQAISDGGSSPIKIVIKEPNSEGKMKISTEYGCSIFSTSNSVVIKIIDGEMDASYCAFDENRRNIYNKIKEKYVRSTTRTYDRRDIIYIERIQNFGTCSDSNCNPTMGRSDSDG